MKDPRDGPAARLGAFLRRLTGASAALPREPDGLIRSENFSIERLEAHAEALAAALRVTRSPRGSRPLARRLQDNGRVLLEAYRSIGEVNRQERVIIPAAEWLLDNFHVVEEQIREIRDDIPSSFYRQLPILAEGPLEGYPRVFGLAWSFVAHTDSLFDQQAVNRFVIAHQCVQRLTIDELRAVAIMLRIVLVDNLRRAAEYIVSSRAWRREADGLADRLLGVGGGEAEPAATAVRRFEQIRLPTAFVVQLVQRLRDQDPAVTPALRWLDERLAVQGTTADEIVREEPQWQRAMGVTVRNAITSMRLMSGFDRAGFEAALLHADVLHREAGDTRRGLQAELLEREAREKLQVRDFQGTLECLLGSIQVDPARKDRVLEEFAFAFRSGTGLEPELHLTSEASDAFDWQWRIWQILAARNLFPLKTVGQPKLEESEDNQERAKAISADDVTAPDREGTPQQKGDKLESAVARLFGVFFDFDGDVPWKIRRQKSGTQGGYDLSIEWSGKCEVATGQRVRCHIECKNYKNEITQKDVAEKLLSEPQQPPVIDHWILISPRANPSNELNRLLEEWQKDGGFPFEVQVWCPETGVAELFGLEPDVYDQFFPPFSLDPDPRTWDEDRRLEVREKWRTLLQPPLRLPRGWPEYVRDPRRLCSPPEDADELNATFENYVPMRCRNTAGALLEKPLRTYVEEWLKQPDKPVLFLLGEFGDGKTCFTYVLARHLLGGWRGDRQTGWLPLRLTLRKFPGNAREFLRQRLEEFSAEVGGWLDLGRNFNRVVILDGFDEMSIRLDPAAVTKNIGDLLACVKEFEGCKLLITSRTHFFENREDAQRLMTRLGNPPVYQLAPIERQEVTRHLFGTVSGEEARRLLDRVHQMNDPIGLASKPLFLEMLKEVLSSPNLPKDLGVLDLYERYIQEALTRKAELLDDPEFRADPQVVVQNLRKILGQIAEELQRTGQGYVSLGQYQVDATRPFAQLLWQLSGTSEADKDALSRVGARSLLGRVVHQAIRDEWPVDFCHRSMREYFVALRLCEAVEASEEQGVSFLKEVALNHEILQFAAERWRKVGSPSIKDRLLALIRRAEHHSSPGRMGGYAVTLLYRLARTLPRDFDWTGRAFDGADLEDADLSGMDFRNCSFRDANLANVNLENANFENCDLTGVRIEETKPVVSLTAVPSQDKLFAFYGDGVLREWNFQPPGKATWKVLGLLPPEPGSVLGLHESGQMWLRTPRSWMFLAPQEANWQPKGSFAVKDGYGCVWTAGNLMALVEKSESDAARVLLVDLERQGTLNDRKVSRLARWCAALGNEGLVWSDAGVGFRVASMHGEPPEAEITLSSPEPTCLGIRRCGFGEYLLAGGVGDGRICVWRLDLKGTTWAEQKVLDAKVHDGPVTSVAFTSDACVASGGADRAIILTRFGEDATLAGHTERRLQLRLRCKGMKIGGVKGPAEHEVLARCIAESS